MDELNLYELRNKCLTSLYTCTENISKYLDENQKTEEYKKLKTCVIEYCKMELQEDAGKKTVQSFEGVSDFDDWASLKKKYENKLCKRTKQRVKFDKHPFVKELEKHIKTVERSQGEQEDLAITETTNNYTDPISKRPINNPVRNIICNHVYDKESIESFIRNINNRGCPMLGCTNQQPMLPQHLQLDEQLLLTIRSTQQASQDQEEV